MEALSAHSLAVVASEHDRSLRTHSAKSIKLRKKRFLLDGLKNGSLNTPVINSIRSRIIFTQSDLISFANRLTTFAKRVSVIILFHAKMKTP